VTSPIPSRSNRKSLLTLILLTAFLAACTDLPFYEQQDDLDDAIKYYNDNFEAKLTDRCAMLVHPDKREEFLTRSHNITSRITFYETKIVNVTLLNKGKPIPINPGFGEGNFDEAHISIRYQVVISPSNSLKTLVVIQNWVLTNGQWRVYPNLDAFTLM
jgi:hypothetical protein